MKLPEEKIERLREVLAGASRGETGAPKRALVVSHYNPDGDALGSSLAWARMLRGMGHEAMVVVPNKFPHFLEWIPGIGEVKVFSEHEAAVRKAAREADLVCCLDFNNISRLEGLTAAIEANPGATKLLIDHHLDPSEGYFDIEFSHPDACSTSYIVCRLIERLCGAQAIDADMGTALYVGIMTDTGNFSYSFLTPELFRTVAMLVERGIDIPAINTRVYNSYTEGRVRLLGYALGPKMEILQNGRAAVISLTEEELRKFNFKQGDSEGFVNYPLSIETVKMSAMLTQNRQQIRVSLRSRGDVDVNLFARKYFDGGGHKNAAGGKSCLTMDKTLAKYREAVEEFFKEEHI